jgi:RNA polymerase sigma-70 factor (ECF subfamily)
MPPAPPSDQELVAGLRAGDEMAFRTLVNRYHTAMRRLAGSLVTSPAIADEVVQETWLAVIRGIDRFEERSSLKTWIFRILVNRARTLGGRESRTTPFSSLQSAGEEEGPTVDPERFLADGHAFGGYWSVPPTRFFELPEERVLNAESVAMIEQTIGELPARQQQVIRMRDVDGWGSEEVCACLGLSEANQRVLLHRARATVRSVLEAHFSERVHA